MYENFQPKYFQTSNKSNQLGSTAVLSLIPAYLRSYHNTIPLEMLSKIAIIRSACLSMKGQAKSHPKSFKRNENSVVKFMNNLRPQRSA